MANEITVGMTLTVNNPNLQNTWQPGSAIRADQAAAAQSGIGQNVSGTSWATVTLGATVGWTFIRNLSTTMTVELGTGSGTNLFAFHRLLPGEAFIGRLAGTTLVGRCTTTSAAQIAGVVLAA